MANNQFIDPIELPDDVPIMFGSDAQVIRDSGTGSTGLVADDFSCGHIVNKSAGVQAALSRQMYLEACDAHWPIDIFTRALPTGANGAGARAMAVNNTQSMRRSEFPANSFVHTSDTIIQGLLTFPPGYSGQSLIARFRWFTLDTAVGDPVQNVRMACILLNEMADGTNLDVDLGQLSNPAVTKAYAGPKVWHVSSTASFVPSGIIGGDMVICQMRRINSGVSNNLATTVYLAGATLEIA